MKRKITPKLIVIATLVAVIAIVVPLGTGCLPKAAAPPAVAPPEEVQTWHLRGISPQGRSIVERDSIAQCCDIITEASGGRVTFDWYAGGELMPSEEEIPALKAGTIDMLQWYPLMGTVTELRTIECGAPFATKNAVEFRALIYHRGLKELFAESYEEQGLYYIGPSLHDPLETCSRLPAYSLEDMAGQRIQLLAEHAYPYEQVGVACMPSVVNQRPELYSIFRRALWKGSAGLAPMRSSCSACMRLPHTFGTRLLLMCVMLPTC